MQLDNRNYYLVMRSGKNSFLPVDWSQTSFYENENLYSLSGIDKFTSKAISINLLKECLRLNLISQTDLFSSFEILYVENGINHTVKEGPIFREDEHIISEDELIEYIIMNKNNKAILNDILMQCNIKETDELLEGFKLLLRNIQEFGMDIETLRYNLEIFKNLSYFQKRSICIRVSNKVLVREGIKIKEKSYNEVNVA